MIHPKQMACAAGFLVLSTGLAAAMPARVATDLNVRSGEGTGYPVVAVMPAGAVVDVRGCGDGWCYVSDYDGFASASYLDGGFAVGSAGPAYVAPPAAVVVPGPGYRDRYFDNGDRFIRRGVRAFRRELRRDARQDWRQDRREARQDLRQDRREVRQERRREARQDLRQDRREVRQERRREARQDRRQERRESRAER